MKTILTFLMALAFSVPALAQDGWKVVHHGKERLSTSAENPAGNVVTLKNADLLRTGNLVVRYKEQSAQDGWQRWIAVFDPEDNELFKSRTTQLVVPNARLRALLKKSPTLKVYTWALPTDPELAARIRIRRVHLCTLKLRD